MPCWLLFLLTQTAVTLSSTDSLQRQRYHDNLLRRYHSNLLTRSHVYDRWLWNDKHNFLLYSTNRRGGRTLRQDTKDDPDPVAYVPVQVSMDETEPLALRNLESGTLTCKIYGKPPPTNITWIRESNGNTVRNNKFFRILIYNTSVNQEHVTSEFYFKSMQLRLEDRYECRAENTILKHRYIKSAYRNATRAEEVKVSILSEEVLSREIGNQTTLDCEVTGIPTPYDVTWQFCGTQRTDCTEIIENDEYRISQRGVYDDLRNSVTVVRSSLTLKAKQWRDRGTYKCAAKNNIRGEVISAESLISLNIVSRVEIIPLQEVHQIKLGSSANFSCSAVGYPRPDSITWYFNETILHLSQGVTTIQITESFKEIKSILWIGNVTKERLGRYDCVSSNFVLGTSHESRGTIILQKPRPLAIAGGLLRLHLLIAIICLLIFLLLLIIIIILCCRWRRTRKSKQEYSRMQLVNEATRGDIDPYTADPRSHKPRYSKVLKPKWQCSRCLTWTPFRRRLCDRCGADAPASWSCKKCGSINSLSNYACSACSTPHPTALRTDLPDSATPTPVEGLPHPAEYMVMSPVTSDHDDDGVYDDLDGIYNNNDVKETSTSSESETNSLLNSIQEALSKSQDDEYMTPDVEVIPPEDSVISEVSSMVVKSDKGDQPSYMNYDGDNEESPDTLYMNQPPPRHDPDQIYSNIPPGRTISRPVQYRRRAKSEPKPNNLNRPRRVKSERPRPQHSNKPSRNVRFGPTTVEGEGKPGDADDVYEEDDDGIYATLPPEPNKPKRSISLKRFSLKRNK